MTGIRYPNEQIAVMDAIGGNRTEGAVRLADIAIDAVKELGDAWIDVIQKAEADDVMEGEALGRLAKLGAEVERERLRKAKK